MPAYEPNITLQEFNQWLNGNNAVIPPVPGLKSLVASVHTANTAWFDALRAEFDDFENDAENKGKITILENLDEALDYSFQNVVIPTGGTGNLDEILGGLLVEIEGYKRLSDRYFKDLLKLSETDRLIKQAARDARTNLFNKLQEVQRFLQDPVRFGSDKSLDITPREFDPCTSKFLTRLQNLGLPPTSKAAYYTEELFRNRRLGLLDAELRDLITVWGDVVSIFVKDTQDTDNYDSQDPDEYEFGEPATIADFICIHDRLDTLYSRLSTNVSRNN